MKRISPYLKMRVLGALEYAQAPSLEARYKEVSKMVFKDEDGLPRQFTWRTIQTWWYYYRRHGLTEPVARVDKGTTRKITPEELLEAIESVLPDFHDKKRNLTAIYRACIEKGVLRPDQIARTTFGRIVKEHDLLEAEHQNSPRSRKAFAKPHANDLWQADTLHGPYLHLDGKNNKPCQVFLICFIDDASRVVPHGGFYCSDNTENLLHCLQTALFKRGVPRALYVDNGSNYSAKELSLIATRLGTLLLHTPVRDGAAKGKIERFFRTVRDQFLVRNLRDINSLHQLNTEFLTWVEDTYHMREHKGIGMRPLDRFGLDLDRLRFLNPNPANAELFHLEVSRKVRTDNTFSLYNTIYESPRDLRHRSISVRFSRFYNLTTIKPVVYLEDQRLGEAFPLARVQNDRHPLGPDERPLSESPDPSSLPIQNSNNKTS